MTLISQTPDDAARRWTMWDLFLRTGTAELCDAGLDGVDVVPDYPAQPIGAARIAVGHLVRFGLDRANADGVTTVDFLSTHVTPGAVVAVHSEGAENAVMGGRLASRVIASGGCAVVTDGRLRDCNELGRLPIGAWATAPTPSGGTAPGGYRLITGSSKLFGLEWADGDWYAQDEDGAVRISKTALEAVLSQFGRTFNR